MGTDSVGVVGAGTMGAGIARLAASAGCRVSLLDMRHAAAAHAKEAIAAQLAKRVTEGKLAAGERHDLLERLIAAEQLTELKPCSIVIEAIAESLSAKRELFAQLEALVAPSAVLASNTSSLSITALARDLRYRGRFVGMHFFNPVHSMKLVEVVAGIDSAPDAIERVAELARAWGKVAVIAKSTPGFIVNRIARPFYAEALMLLQEGRASAELIDSAMRGAGFKMGPCELMDLIGHDVNLAVTESMFRSHYGDRRFTPSLVQQELVDAGRLGRKSGRGFYVYPGEPRSVQSVNGGGAVGDRPVYAVIVRGSGQIADDFLRRFERTHIRVTRQGAGGASLDFIIDGERLLTLQQTDGRTAAQLALSQVNGCRGVFDWSASAERDAPLAVAFSSQVTSSSRAAVLNAFQAAGIAAVEMADSPALIVARTLCMLINEAADAIQQNVCSPEAANLAMRLGVNYPAGPFEWLEALSTDRVVTVLENLGAYYQGERYRVSPWLQERRWREILPPK
jgi:3-hydroxybutyryl-CoA dehydrogenase